MYSCSLSDTTSDVAVDYVKDVVCSIAVTMAMPCGGTTKCCYTMNSRNQISVTVNTHG